MRHADSALEVFHTSGSSVLTEVMFGMEFVEVTHAVDIAWVEHELVCFGNKTREESQWDHKQYTKPEVGRMEEVVIVAVDRCDEPTRLDSRVDSLQTWKASLC
jgi:hypothetical protein